MKHPSRPPVEGVMPRARRRNVPSLPLLLFVLLLAALAARPLRAADATADPDSDPRDALVYKDGDRLQGRLISQEGGRITFKSDRFGTLQVSTADAVVIKAEKPPREKAAARPPAKPPPGAPAAPAAPAGPAVAQAEDREDAEQISLWERFSPWILTAKVRNFFGPWHGRFAVSTELVDNSAQERNFAFDAHLQRKWKADEVQLNGHYDYSETDQITSTDLVKADGSWHHDFKRGRFMLYSPSVEWNRANVVNRVRNDYVLLHQEIGAGVAVLDKPGRKIRLGLSENLFDVWNDHVPPAHNTRAVESGFDEAELKLPWRMALTQRAVLYNPFHHGRLGWEDTAELDKKLTETLSVSIRHEIRRNNPDGSAQDYTRLKLLLGLDF